MDKQRIKNHLEEVLHELKREMENDLIQPKIDKDLLLLCRNHIQGDTHIDLYGTYDVKDDSCEVVDFTLTDSKIPLWDLQPSGSDILHNLTNWINGTMKSEYELRAEANQDAAIDRAEERKLV